MSDFVSIYKGILSEAKPTGDGYLSLSPDDIHNSFIKQGYNHYRFGGWQDVYTKRKLTEEEIEKCERKAREEMDVMVSGLSARIDQMILQEIMKKGKKVRLKTGEIITVVPNQELSGYINKDTTEYIHDDEIEEFLEDE